jgi:hypothetical protein
MSRVLVNKSEVSSVLLPVRQLRATVLKRSCCDIIFDAFRRVVID